MFLVNLWIGLALIQHLQPYILVDYLKEGVFRGGGKGIQGNLYAPRVVWDFDFFEEKTNKLFPPFESVHLKFTDEISPGKNRWRYSLVFVEDFETRRAGVCYNSLSCLLCTKSLHLSYEYNSTSPTLHLHPKIFGHPVRVQSKPQVGTMNILICALL